MGLKRVLAGISTIVVAVAALVATGPSGAWADEFSPIHFNPDQRIQLLSSVAANRCLDIKAEDGINRDRSRAQTWECHGANEQKFTFNYAQTSASGQECLDVSNASTAVHTIIWQWTCNGTNAQRIFPGFIQAHEAVGCNWAVPRGRYTRR